MQHQRQWQENPVAESSTTEIRISCQRLVHCSAHRRSETAMVEPHFHPPNRYSTTTPNLQMIAINILHRPAQSTHPPVTRDVTVAHESWSKRAQTTMVKAHFHPPNRYSTTTPNLQMIAINLLVHRPAQSTHPPPVTRDVTVAHESLSVEEGVPDEVLLPLTKACPKANHHQRRSLQQTCINEIPNN